SYDPQFSPKAGVVVTPVEGHTFRLFYNRAFKSPSTLQTEFYIPNFVANVGVFGNREGMVIKNGAGATVRTYDPLVPEENQTWELGYKGLINGRLFFDVAAYYSRYEHFLSPLVTVANPFGGAAATFAFRPDGTALVSETGGQQIILTYFNLGEATIYGTDAAVRYVVNPRLDLTGTVSLLKLDKITGINTNIAGEVEATALNSPATKWTVGANLRDLGRWLGGATVRHVTGYQFNSGINKGHIPTHNTLDLNVGYKVPRFGSQINLGVSNLFTCRSNDPTIADEGAECGFGVKHREMINMPAIGTMVFLGLRFTTN
ncbi:MAG TPA: TonB-dependent receptor, partial [Longimicrobium sp.]|nr:TonB-dependent receptor [Longimicrobium sp.]